MEVKTKPSLAARICNSWRVTDEEYSVLNKKYGNLCEYAGWQLITRNNRNNHTSDQEDISQDLRIALLIAGSYYKRQTYIENGLSICADYIKDKVSKLILNELKFLWKNKTSHGANRQRFGQHQEDLLETLLERWVPEEYRPSKTAPLEMDAAFGAYCKGITWNTQRALGKKITKEKPLRDGMVSISEFDYLGKDY